VDASRGSREFKEEALNQVFTLSSRDKHYTTTANMMRSIEGARPL
jgi:hypothetical protein